ncbi:uncharacterized protein AB675_5460 [Cyphellophora attinorum]|uniref:SMP-30/Gluconolactonase/LRE-like region domain-containing protein n=1 Tax=Cyphellophora attinorum TaxID=1664694 RepID=A0A0N0NNP9_9EURO|nr:uncharacterized protein AB675_5460 [Phialophora attinorum]KPI41841.1 hypothetical protein AB675_5460 [Phialophora attinorum]
MSSINSISALLFWCLAITPAFARLSYPKPRQAASDLTPIMFSEPLLEPNIIATFDNGIWIENLAARSTDGNFVGTVLSKPQVYLISYDSKFDPVIVAEFPEYTACLGIVELGLDVFYAVIGNFSTKTFTSTQGSYSIWEINLNGLELEHDSEGHWSDWKRGTQAQLKKVADLPDAGLANGLTVLNPTLGILLVADSINGIVWSVNVRTGDVASAIKDATMAPQPDLSGGLPLGINGLVASNGYLYYDNTNTVTFYRSPINSTTGAATGPAELLIDQEFANIFPDDFTLDFAGNAWLACEYGHVAFFDSVTNGEKHNITAVAGNSTGLPHGLTSAKFGITSLDLERGSLYVSTNGDPFSYGSDEPAKGQLVRYDTAVLGYY